MADVMPEHAADGSRPPVEAFSNEDRARLAPFVTNCDRPVFVLTNLSEVVKGALFARYSRSAKSLRRLLLDEFLTDEGSVRALAGAGDARGEQLFDKVFVQYGDDSVAQLGGVHIACEGASNILTKALEWGRLAAYLEQSTRYVPYDDRPGGAWKYHVPRELQGHPLQARYVQTMDLAFSTYAKWLAPMQAHLSAKHPPPDGTADGAYRASIRAKALDALRGLLPASTRSNVGIYATGQAYENMLLRMRASPETEVQDFGQMILEELRQVIPAFVKRVDREDRGVVWSRYLSDAHEATLKVACELLADVAEAHDVPEVSLTDYDPEGELKVVAAALYSVSRLPDAQLLEVARGLSSEQRAEVLKAYIGDRQNRRHRPGRAFERTSYRFDVLGDYGAFRDLQRHRLLSLEWQPLSTRHGYAMNEAVADAGAEPAWQHVMQQTAELYEAMVQAGLPQVAPYVVPMAYRVRYYMHMNARAAMHLLELRSAPQGHAAYRRVAQAMHRLITDEAKHTAIADAMRFVNHEQVDLERLEAERRSAARQASS